MSAVGRDSLREARDSAWVERLRDTFKQDALERLTRAEYDYYSTHGHYVPGLARLALHHLAQRDRLAQTLRLIRDTCGSEFAVSAATLALEEADVADPEEEDHP